MSAYDLAFYLIAAMALAGAAITVLSRRLVYAAFSLLLAFLGVAGLYALLAADFLAIAQVIVYVGGILVLLLFGVMLTHRIYDTTLKSVRVQPLLGGLVAAGVAVLLIRVAWNTPWNTTPELAREPTTAKIGEAFMKHYVFPFEFVSLILLVALIGAALIGRSRAPKSGNGR